MGDKKPKSSQLTIRRGVAADRAALAAADAFAADHPERIDQIADWLAFADCLVAEQGGRPVGYAAVTREFLGKPIISIVVVDLGARRKGVGTQLVEALSQRHSGQRLWASTNGLNWGMRDLLSKAGFRIAGQVEGLDAGDVELFLYRDS